MAKKSKVSKNKSKLKMDSIIALYLGAFLIITLSIIAILELGFVGVTLANIMKYLVGNLYALFFLLMIVVAISLLWKKRVINISMRYLLAIFFLLFVWMVASAFPSEDLKGFDILFNYVTNTVAMFKGQLSFAGGIIGAFFISLLTVLFDITGTKVVLVALAILAICLLLSGRIGLYLNNIKEQGIKKAKEKAQKNKEKQKKKETKREIENLVEHEDKQPSNKQDQVEIESEREEILPISIPTTIEKKEEKTSKQSENIEIIENVIGKKDTFVSQFAFDIDAYSLPSINLLDDVSKKNKDNTNQKSASECGQRLIELLEQFGVKAKLVAIQIGPTVTRFEIKPDLGVRVNKISSLQQDIKMALAASEIRIEAPIPGKSAVGIEIPNAKKNTVSMRELLTNVPNDLKNKSLLIALGKDLSGNCIYGELNKMPHLLIAGATGSGKSVCVNSIITSILMRTTPDQVKLLLIDPKKVEFTPYKNVPHLIAPVITDGEQANRSLKVVVKMMEKRYDIFAKLGVKNIEGYYDYLKANPSEELDKMPWLVVIIDELADLMLAASKEVEASIQRITQLARAAGIHLIVATQRPSVDVITGVIKSNIPSRIAFQVSSNVDSRTIIDQQGAERLLGNGDMLYVPRDSNVPLRVQGVYVSDNEVEKICNFVSQQAKPKFDDRFLLLESVESNDDDDVIEIQDPLFDEVKSFVIETRKASTSLIQRKFSVGYARAARLVDLMEEQGIIGPSRGSKPREVLVKYEDVYADE